jgi:hypothetical protein
VIPLVAAVCAGVVGLAACSSNSGSPAPPAATTTDVPVAAPPPAAPLPPPSALTDVLYRLSDPAVPGAEKVGLIEYATVDDAEGLDKFGRALKDSGFTPLTFDAADMAWSESNPGNAHATVTVNTANQQAGKFTFPMEFTAVRDRWQLTRETADLLLELGEGPTSTTPPR